MGFFDSVAKVAGPISAGVDFFSARDTQKKQKKAAREQMAFQERMSNTAYQRAVKDMKAAGINPILAYQQGGASSPGGAQPNLVAPKIGNKLIQGAQVNSAVKLQKAQTGLTEAQEQTAKQVQRKEAAQADLLRQEADFAKQYPDIYNAWKLGGWKAAAGQTAASSAKEVQNWFGDEVKQTTEGIKQIGNQIKQWFKSQQSKQSGKRRTRRGSR